MNMKLINIKNIDSIEKGIKLLNMRNNEVVIIEDIKDNTIKIKDKDKYISLSTVKNRTFTANDIKSMSAEEINKNWEQIKNIKL